MKQDASTGTPPSKPFSRAVLVILAFTALYMAVALVTSFRLKFTSP